MVKCPKNSVNRTGDVKEIVNLKYQHAKTNSKKDQDSWYAAVQSIGRSQDDVYMQATGDNKGMVKGIPKDITNPRIRSYIEDIVKGVRNVDEERHELTRKGAAAAAAAPDALDVKGTKIFQDRKYRDSNYAILAALWKNYAGVGENFMGTTHLKATIQRYTDHPIDYDYNMQVQGVWKAKDALVAKEYICQIKPRGGGEHSFGLTRSGVDLCKALFCDKFHPRISAQYVLVEPPGGVPGRAAAPAAAAAAAAGGGGGGGARAGAAAAAAAQARAGNNHNSPQPSALELRHRRMLNLEPARHALAEDLLRGGLSLEEAYRILDDEDADKVAKKRRLDEEMSASKQKPPGAAARLPGAGAGAAAAAAAAAAFKAASPIPAKAAAAGGAGAGSGAKSSGEVIVLVDSQDEMDDDDEQWVQAQIQAINEENRPRPPKRSRGAAASSNDYGGDYLGSDDDDEYNNDDDEEEDDDDDDVFNLRPKRRGSAKTKGKAGAAKAPAKAKAKAKAPAPAPRKTQQLQFSPTAPIDLTMDSQESSMVLNDFDDFDDEAAAAATAAAAAAANEDEEEEEEEEQQAEALPVLPPAKALWLIVDSRERMHNDDWMRLLQQLRVTVPSHTPSCRVTGASLNIGDYMWIFAPDAEAEAGGGGGARAAVDEDRADVDRGLVYPMMVERKTLKDLISRSAESRGSAGPALDGPHFKQERAMRFSSVGALPCKHAFLLLEGEVTERTCAELSPRVGNDDDKDDPAAPDSIVGYPEVISATVALVARNIGSPMLSRVLVLQTSKEMSAQQLAALTCVAAHDDSFDERALSIPFGKFDSENRHQLLSREMADLHSFLADKGVSDSFCRLIERRFGSQKSLNETLCGGGGGGAVLDPSLSRAEKAAAEERQAKRGAAMLFNLTHGGANTRHDTSREDMAKHNAEARKVYNLVAPPRLSCSLPLRLDVSETALEVQTSEQCHADLGCDDAVFPRFMSFALLPEAHRGTGSLAASLFWCKVVKVNRALRLCSAPLFVISIAPALILSQLVMAAHRANDEKTPELVLVKDAWEHVKILLPPLALQAIGALEAGNPGKSDGQVVVVVLEGIGFKSNQGATGRLCKALNNHCNKEGGGASKMLLPPEFGAQWVHTSAVRSIDARSSFLMALAIAYLSHSGLQVLQTKNQPETHKYVISMLHEVNRQGLLTRDV